MYIFSYYAKGAGEKYFKKEVENKVKFM